MTKSDIANFLFKAFSIYAFLQALQNVPFLINDIIAVQEPVLPGVMQIITPTSIMLLSGILLWGMSGRGAKIILGYEGLKTIFMHRCKMSRCLLSLWGAFW
jgi:hypothetical protein